MELSTSTKTSNVNVIDYARLAVRGFFPEIVGVTSERIRSAWLLSYVEQLVTRDASELVSGTDSAKLRSYFEALSLNTAGLITDSSLYQAVGFTAKTARRYDDLLVDLGVAVDVPAWSTNRLQRLEKRAKRYLVDTFVHAQPHPKPNWLSNQYGFTTCAEQAVVKKLISLLSFRGESCWN